jgi:hypothetical protein
MALLTLSPAAGTQPDLVSRLKSVLPTGWFADSTPVLDGVLNGLAAGWAGVFGLLGYVQMQTRIATASDTFLDLVAADFFAGRITRSAGEPDESLRARIDRELLRERATRGALQSVLLDFTGRPAKIFEPTRLQDTGAYGVASTLAYGVVGGYGSFALPFQCFVRAYRPIGGGVANSNGYGGGLGGYGVGGAQYVTLSMAARTVLDSAIAAAIAETMPVATTAWLAVSD